MTSAARRGPERREGPLAANQGPLENTTRDNDGAQNNRPAAAVKHPPQLELDLSPRSPLVAKLRRRLLSLTGTAK